MTPLNKEELQKAFESNRSYPDWILDDLAQSIYLALCKKNEVTPIGLDVMDVHNILMENNWDYDDSFEKLLKYFNNGFTRLLLKQTKPKKAPIIQPKKKKFRTNKKLKELSHKEVLRREFRKQNSDPTGLNDLAEAIQSHYSKWST